jgi:hypothetical protein
MFNSFYVICIESTYQAKEVSRQEKETEVGQRSSGEANEQEGWNYK